MRVFELLLLASLTSVLTLLFFGNRTNGKLFHISIAITTTLLLSHLIIEQARWQMTLIYIFSVILVSACFIPTLSRKRWVTSPLTKGRKILRTAAYILSMIVLLSSGIPPLMLPVFSIPEPSGDYEVGSTVLCYQDTTRPDVHAEEPGRFREVSLRVWYPAEVKKEDKRLRYMNHQEARSLAALYSMPPFLLDHFRLSKTDSYRNASPREGSYPVILYSPSGDMVQNTTLFQELASHGYVVFSVGHPYWNAYSYDVDGRVVPFSGSHPYYTSMWEEERSDSVNAIKEEITSAAYMERKRNAHNRLNIHMPLERADIRLWAEDMSFLLDVWSNPEMQLPGFIHCLDLEKIGVMGFSKGGAAAGQFCIRDSRCKAGVNLSGFMFGDVLYEPISCPFLFMENTEEWCPGCGPISEVFFEDASHEAYMLRITGARHGNFSDWSLVGPFLKLTGMIGRLNGDYVLEIQSSIVRSFFDRYLKGSSDPDMDDLAKGFPEVFLDTRNAPAH
jgi:hypothetical protein